MSILVNEAFTSKWRVYLSHRQNYDIGERPRRENLTILIVFQKEMASRQLLSAFLKNSEVGHNRCAPVVCALLITRHMELAYR